MNKYIRITFFSLTLLFALNLEAQTELINSSKRYQIGEITVEGNSNFSNQTIVAYSGLKKGDRVYLPGEKISNAIKKLWKTNLFSDIEIYATRINEDTVDLEIKLFDLPELNTVTIHGVKKRKKEELIDENKLNKGVKVTENLITTTRNYLTNKYRKSGYYETEVKISTREVVDSIQKKRVDMYIDIDKGNKIKVKDIIVTGNTAFKDKRIEKSMRHTKKRKPFRIFKRSKYIAADFREDLVSIVDKYKESGYRDARILKDSLVQNDDHTLSIYLDLEEGDKYTFGKIDFVGNSVFSDGQLQSILRIREGDKYNGVLLKKRIADDSKPDAEDLTNLYQNSGYLFSQINPVEVSAEGNVIDMEIRIIEGKPAYFNNVTVVGNDRTNDKVIYRELRTRPGQLYSKENVVRTIRELSQMGFFDPEQISPNFKNPNPTDGTLDMEYSVVEQGSSQIELQGGYGGGGFIGTLGLSFNNFAIKDIFNKKAYQPVPIGDGQKLSLRLQASRFYQTYSFSFAEPWLGGKKPVQFSSSLSHSKQFLYDYTTRRADKSRSFNITGITFGLAKRLTVPDDYFTLSQALSFQRYDLNNYNTGLFKFGDGYSNNLSYTIGLSRNSSGPNPIYPMVGSNFSVSAKLSLPYSVINKVDYKDLIRQRDEAEEVINGYDPSGSQYSLKEYSDAIDKRADIDQERYRWLEFYKIKFKIDNYTRLFDKLVLRPSVEFGFLGAYNNDRGVIPFERFYLGGDGLGNFSLDGRETIGLRGYPNQSLTPLDPDTGDQDGATIYNKFSLELRYPITLGQTASIYSLLFLEGGAAYNSFRNYNPFDIKRSAGFGIRIFMPAFGLLGIDFGHGYDAIENETVKNGWETHFIIGQQFW